MCTLVEEVSPLIGTHNLIDNHLLSLYTAVPMIDPPSLPTVTVSVGSPLTLPCTSRGSPPDTFTWRKDSGPMLQSTSITTVEHTSTTAVFHASYSIDGVTLDDSGSYTCTVTNPIGSDSETINVTVIGMFCKRLEKYTSFTYSEKKLWAVTYIRAVTIILHTL